MFRTDLTNARTETSERPVPASGLWALGAWILGLSLTLWLTLSLHQYQAERLQARFTSEVDRVVADIERRFQRPQYGLMGARGVYAASGSVSRREFTRYVESRDLPFEFPGVRGIGFIERLPREGLDAFLERERADEAPDFAVRTSGQADDLYVIKFIEPLARNRAARGLDVGAEAVRREAAERAAKTGRPALTGIIQLVQDELSRPGFLLFVPVYYPGLPLDTAEQRLAALHGLTYAPIVLQELMEPGLELLLTSGLHLHLSDKPAAEGGATLFSAGSSHGNPLLSTERTIMIAGTPLVLGAHSTPALEATANRALVYALGLAGVLLSSLLALVLWQQATGRARAEARAQSMTADLQKLALVAERTANVVMMTDAQLRINWVNEGFTRVTGYTAEEAIGKRPGELLSSGKAAPEILEKLRTSAEQGLPCRVGILNRAKDGREFWVDTEIQPIRNAAGVLTGFIEIGLDITQERETNERLMQAALESQAQQQELDVLARVARETSNAVILTDAQGQIEWVNEGFTRITGYRLGEVLGEKPGHLLQCPETDPATVARMRAAIAAQQSCNLEILNRRKDGNLYWLDLQIQPLYDDSGRHTGFMAIESDITDRKEAERALKESEQRFKGMLDIASDWYWETDTEFRFTSVIATHDISHHKVLTQPALGKRRWEIEGIDPLAGGWEHHMAQHQRHESFRDFEYRRELPNGEVRHYAVSGFAVFDTFGRFTGYRGTTRDTTEQKLQENRLLNAIHENQALMSAIDQGTIYSVADLQGNILDLNREFERISGFSRQELIGQNHRLLKSGVQPDSFWREAWEKISRGQVWRGEVCNRAKGGSYYWVDSTIVPLVGRDGMVEKYISIRTDITERKHSQLQVDEQRKRLDNIIRGTNVGTWEWHVPSGQTVFNERWAEIIGYTLEELGEVSIQTWLKFGHPDDLVASGEALNRHFSGELDYYEFECRMRHKNGHWVWVLDRGQVATWEPDGAPGWMYGTHQDISQQKAQAEALMAAKTQAEQASQFKSQFLANMSHEIRTPMNAILGMLRLLHNTRLQPRQLDYVKKTEGAAKSLLGLLNDILDFSKVEAGRMSLDVHPFGIEALLRDLSIIFSASVGSKPVELLFDIDPAVPPFLMGDALRLQQILINLGGNAIKFTEAGEVVLRMRLEALNREAQPPMARVHFEVKDTGIGIAPENQARIFVDFAQAEASTTRRFGGTGLGLSISSRLIQMMGGHLALESEEGKGSSFSFSLDLPVPLEKAGERATAAALPGKPLAGVSVLVVDDHPGSRQLLATMGSAMGCDVEVADNEAEMLQRLRMRAQRGEPYQAILLDGSVSGVNGSQLRSSVQELLGQDEPPSRCVTVLMVSAAEREMLAHSETAASMAIDGFLIKPVTASMLREAIEDALGAPRQASAQVAPAHHLRSLEGLRLLLVEDNAINQQVAQELLSSQGAAVCIADNGLLGVQALESAVASGQPYDAVLMDMQMPVMDGLQATGEIRQKLGLLELPIIAMTANALASDRELCLSAGMNDHIGKPFDLDKLTQTILRWTRGRGDPSKERGTPAADPSTPGTSEVEEGPRVSPPAWVDWEGALGRVGGNSDLLKRLCGQFVEDLPGLLQGCEWALDAAHQEQGQRAMHTLKGVAATVGAHALAQAAMQAEAASRRGDAVDLEGVKAVAHQTLRVMLENGWADVRHAAPDGGQEPSALTDSEREILSRLLSMLESSDMAAFELMEQLPPGATPGRWEELQRAVFAMAFEQAAQWVRGELARSV